MSLENKIVFIASSGSFLGKELIKNFLKKKYFIITYSNYQLPIKKNNYVRFNNLNKLANFLKNIKKIDLLFLNNGVIGNEYEFNYLIRSHLIKTFNILKITKNIKIERLIYFCSADENGFSNTSIKETNIINPQNKYGLIKSLTTKYIKNICNNRKINYTFFKLFLVVGKTQKVPRIFALIKKCILTNTTFLIKTPNHFKNILYIDDFISIINRTIANKKTINEEYNLGSDLNIRMIDLCKQIKKHNPKFSFKKLKFNEIKKQIPDISKLQKIIGNFKFINIDKIIRLIL